jgi:hypothetical protein
MTVDINNKVRVHTQGGIELNEPAGGWNFGSLAGGELNEEGISSNGAGVPPKWLRFTTFKELDYATVRSESADGLNIARPIGSGETLLFEVTTEAGLDRHLISASCVFSVTSETFQQVRPRIFMDAIRSRKGPDDNSAAYQAMCYSTFAEMKGSQMSVTVYTTVITPGNTAPLNVKVMGKVMDGGPSVIAVDGSLSVLSWHDPD